MSNVKGSSFGVRFYRRAIPKASVKPDANMEPAARNVQNDERPQPESMEIMNDIPEQQPAVKQAIHPLQELTSPKQTTAQVQAPDTRETLREKALWMAAKSGDCYAIRLLVMDGVDLEARDGQGRTAVNIATQYNQIEAIKTLMAAKEMRRMAKLGELPESRFFKKFDKAKTGSR